MNYDETNNGELIPQFRAIKIDKAMKQIQDWKEEGYTRDEVMQKVDRRVVVNSDIDKIYPPEESKEQEENSETNEKQESSNSEEKQENLNLEEEQKDEINNNLQEENEDLIEENFQDENLNEETKENSDEIVNSDEDNEENLQDEGKEEFKLLRDDELVDYEDQPFRMYTEQEENEMIKSIKLNGIIEPIVVRPIEDNKYQILSGRNRRRCGKKAGLKLFPCKIRYGLTDEEAKLYVIDSNLITRESISTMERAKALFIRKNIYKAKKIRAKIQAQMLEDNSDDINVREKIKNVEDMSEGNLQRYLRLNYLDESLQKLVDDNDKKLSLSVAEQLSFLKKPEQKVIADLIENKNKKISLKQALDFKNDEDLNTIKIKEVLDNDKVKKEIKITINENEISDLYDLNSYENVKKLKEQILNDLREFRGVQN